MFRQHDRSSALLVYLIMSAVMTFARSLILTILAVYYIAAVGMNPLQLVLVGTVFESAIVLFEVPTGVVADTFSRRLSVIIGMLILGAALVLEGLVPLVVAVMVAEAIGGVGETFLSGATDAWLADEIGEEQVGRVYVRAAQINRVVGIAGMLVSAGLATIQLNLPVVLGGGLFLALGLFLMICMPERGFQPTPRGARTTWQAMFTTFREGAAMVRASPVLLALLAVNLFAGAAGEGFDKLWEAHILLDLSLPTLGAIKPVVWFGIINSGTTVVSLLVIAILRRRLDAVSRKPVATARALLVINILLVCSVIIFGLAGNFRLAFGALVVKAVLSSLGDPLYRTWLIQQTSPRVRATVLSISSQSHALGETAGGPLVGAIATVFSLRVALVVAGMLLAPVAALYARTMRRGAHQAADGRPETGDSRPETGDRRQQT
jgi:DHA3 family tetracycline resistance protein-like MFS transporter